MREKKQIESAEKMAELLQDYILLGKTQRKLKDSELVERQLNELRDSLINLVEIL